MLCTKKEKKLVLLMYFWLWWSTTTNTSSSMQHVKAEDTYDSLKAGYSTSILRSKQGKYWLGFQPTNDNNDTFLIIFNAEEPQQVWLSDRNLPADPNAVLSLDQYGVLKIEPGCPKEPGNPKYPKEPGQPKCPKEPGYPREPGYRKEPIILYSPSDQANNTLARLLDTGNFVLQQLHPNGTVTVLWQSFDYPAYTLLPTMKLGFNRITRRNWSLVSQLTSSLWAPGAFSLEWDPKARELVMKRRGKACWRSGKLNESSGMFENIREEVQGSYEYTVDEDSFTLKTKNHDEEKFMGWILTETGQLKSSEGFIARGDKCYGYNSEGGCERWEDIPTCREAGDEFKAKVGLPNDYNTSFDYNRSYGTSDCRAICWSHCSCSGFTAINPNETGCQFFQWNSTGDAQIDDMEDDFFGQTVTSNLYVLVKAARNSGNGTEMTALPAHHSGGNGTKKWIWISAVVVALLIISSSILCLALKKKIYGLKEKKRREANILDLADSNEFASAKDLEDYLKNRHDIKVFNCTSILAATNGFSPENKLGQGGFGPVYKGILSTGQEVAVKRLSKTSRQGVVEFKNELTFICELQHTNLVQLLGCCIHDKERILIYEYMPNKSLDFYLFDCTRSKLLDWRKRSNIIEGISQGLLYLHKYSRLKVIHRDLKASNILLDENMNPKISDFGMARMFPQQESMVNTNRIVGTYGYMSPEYAMGGICSTKSDVYSFGVLLLEIVSGRRNNSFYDANRPLNLIGHAWELWHEGECLKLVDPALNDTFPLDEVQRCIHVGLLCVEQHANDRPTMSKVISMLTNKSLVVALPRRPAFYVAASNILEGTTSSKMSDITLTHEVSISSEVE